MSYLKRILLTASLTTLIVFSAHITLAKDLDPQTKKNLETAMHGEAYANLKYRSYAEKAHVGGNEELAKLFEESADDEADDHFALEAKALGLVKDNTDNLRDAMEGENYENMTMYKEFSEQAAKAGDIEVARLFERIRADERAHQEAYKAELIKLQHMHASYKP